MVAEKLPPDLILSQIRSAEKTNFDLSTPAVIRLAKAGVTPLIIEQMRSPKHVPAGAPPLRPNSAPQNSKQNSAPPPPAPVTATASTPVPTVAPVPIAASPTAILAPAPVPIAIAVVPQVVRVTVPDAVPFRITLAVDIPADAEVARPLRFTATEDFQVNGVTVIARGAAVYGEISEVGKKRVFGIGGGRTSFKLTKAELAGGRSLNVRALAVRKSDGATQRPVDTGQKEPKDLAAAKGAQYIGYIDGEQLLTLPQK
jgi:hypothetical protein